MDTTAILKIIEDESKTMTEYGDCIILVTNKRRHKSIMTALEAKYPRNAPAFDAFKVTDCCYVWIEISPGSGLSGSIHIIPKALKRAGYEYAEETDRVIVY